MRLFLGIDLPVDQKEKLNATLSPLMQKYPSFNWVDKSLYHATLQFFGEVESINELDEAIKRATYDKTGFFLFGLGLDFFATFQLVIHLQYKRERRIDFIVNDLEHYFPSFSQQRAFVFHTTIARARMSSKQQYFHLRKQLKAVPIDISFPVDKLILFASTKSRGARQYHIVKEYPLLSKTSL